MIFHANSNGLSSTDDEEPSFISSTGFAKEESGEGTSEGVTTGVFHKNVKDPSIS
jgi:hypothetical protein